MRLEGKVAIVTGAGQGIGRACAMRFSQEGATVIVSDVKEKEARDTVEKITDLGGEAYFFICDTGDQLECESLMTFVEEKCGQLDIHVNNAAILVAREFLEFTQADWDRVIRVNLTGYFLAGQAAAKKMVESKTSGSIINMSSVNSVLAIPNLLPYVVSKGGVNQLTKVMALALADNGIRVNGIAPGSIATDMVKQIMVNENDRKKIS